MGAFAPTSTGTTLERVAGSLAVAIFSSCYFYALLWLPAVVFLFLCGSRGAAAALLLPYVVSAVLPAKAYPRVLSTWFFQCALKLHDFEQVTGRGKGGGRGYS